MIGHVYHMGAIEVLDHLMPPPGWTPTAQEKHAYELRLCRQAFETGGAYLWTPAHEQVDPGDAVGCRDDPATVHAEHTATIAHWDLPGTFPHLPREAQRFHLPHLVVAQTACLAEDLSRPDDTGHAHGDDVHGGYKCRLGHLHRGRSPYGSALPPDVRLRIGAALGEHPPPQL